MNAEHRTASDQKKYPWAKSDQRDARKGYRIAIRSDGNDLDLVSITADNRSGLVAGEQASADPPTCGYH